MKKRSLLASLLAALLVLVVFTGCAASSKMAAADTASAPNGYYDSKQEAATAETPMEAPAEPEEEFAYDTVATTEAGGGAAETPEPDDSVADYTAKIIYTASVSIETTEFDKAVAALESQVQKIGGFVESSNVTGDTQYNSDGTTSIVNRWAYYTVRIPCEQFEAFLHETEGFGNVISTSRDAQNVTSAYTDYEARLSSLNTQEERLLDMLSKSEDVETLMRSSSGCPTCAMRSSPLSAACATMTCRSGIRPWSSICVRSRPTRRPFRSGAPSARSCPIPCPTAGRASPAACRTSFWVWPPRCPRWFCWP